MDASQIVPVSLLMRAAAIAVHLGLTHISHGRSVKKTGVWQQKKVYPHPELATGSAILDRIVKPGASLTGTQDIGRLFDVTRPGKYVIQASRRVSDEKDSDIVKSNRVTFTVIQ